MAPRASSPKSPKKRMGYSLGTMTLAGHTVHISLLWLLVLFVFLSVVVTTYAGQMKGLAKREFPDTDVNGQLSVDGFRYKVYRQTYDNVAAVDANDSIGPIQTGFKAGHFLVSANARVTKVSGVTGGNVNIESATAANAAVGLGGGTAMTGNIITTTAVLGQGSIGATDGTSSQFSDANNTACVTISAAAAQTGTLEVAILVGAGPGAPDLP